MLASSVVKKKKNHEGCCSNKTYFTLKKQTNTLTHNPYLPPNSSSKNQSLEAVDVVEPSVVCDADSGVSMLVVFGHMLLVQQIAFVVSSNSRLSFSSKCLRIAAISFSLDAILSVTKKSVEGQRV